MVGKSLVKVFSLERATADQRLITNFQIMNTPFYVFMKLLPKNAASRLFGAFTRLRIPFLSKIARNAFASYYKLDMAEAEYPLSH